MRFGWVYHVYALTCMLQFPVWLFLAKALDYHLTARVLRPRPDLYVSALANSSSSSNAQLAIFERDAPRRLDLEVSLACAGASAFAVLYLVIERLSAEDDFLEQEDAGPAGLGAGGDEDGGGCCPFVVVAPLARAGLDDDARSVLHTLRPQFWAWALLHGFLLQASSAAAAAAAAGESDLWLAALARVGGLYGLCRTAAWERGHLAQCGAAVLYVAWLYHYFGTSSLSLSNSNSSLTLLLLRLAEQLLQVLVVDPLWVVGHMGDAVPGMRLVLRCRLCVVALSGLCLALRLRKEEAPARP